MNEPRTTSRAPKRTRVGRCLPYLLAVLLASTASAAQAASGTRPTPQTRAGHPTAAAGAATPSAVQFAVQFLAATSAYAKAHHDPARFGKTDCVQPTPGRYMCSYATKRPGQAEQCHIMQARWTPALASTFTVTLAGRTSRCASLRDALRSLP